MSTRVSEKKIEKDRERRLSVCVCIRVCVCVRESERVSVSIFNWERHGSTETHCKREGQRG